MHVPKEWSAIKYTGDLSVFLPRPSEKIGFARNLANLWHSPVKVLRLDKWHAVRHETQGRNNDILVVHISKLRRVMKFPD